MWNLPLDLMGTYNQLWKNIQERDEADLALAERAIMWVLCSLEPLRINALLEAIQYAVQGPDIVQKEKQTKQQILSLCQDLLTVDEVEGVWLLPHASVAEFFESEGWTTWKCDAFAAKVSISFFTGHLSDDAEDSEDSEDPIEAAYHYFHSFAYYAGRYWGEHMSRYDEWLGVAEQEQADPDVAVHLKRFLGTPAEGSHSYRRWAKDNSDTRPTTLPLLAICNYGIYHTLRDWWLGGTITEEMALVQDSSGNNALALAASRGCMPMCRRLTELVDVKHPNAGKHARALSQAIMKHKTDIVEFLIMEAKADVNFAEGTVPSAAQFAAMWRPATLQWLIDQGVVDLTKEYIGGPAYANILIAAVAYSNYQSVEILLRAGVDVNAAVQSGAYGSALVAAAEWRKSSRQTYVGIVQLLLNAGADPNPVFEKGPCDNVLMAAAREVSDEWLIDGNRRKEESKEVLQLLLAAGADPTVIPRRSQYGSALAAAAFWGRKEMLQTMISHNGEERAVESLRRSKHRRRRRMFCNSKSVERWKQTATYLAEEVGVSRQILDQIGLWDVEPQAVDGRDYKFVLRYGKRRH
ncbi:hypothetical protein MKX07_004555 [Trichoderma sp. CBMAI-0711]|nr:hypothetical protein MKX07_004555 [Trichoderma sp. CBMAI-0711]